MFQLLSRFLLLRLFAPEVAANEAPDAAANTVTTTSYKTVTPTFTEILDKRQNICKLNGELDFCTDLQAQWFSSDLFGSIGTSSGNPSGTPTSLSPSASASAALQQILSGSAFQLFVTNDDGSISYISINSDGFAYLVGSRTGQLFQWSQTSIKTYETNPREFLALADSDVSSRRHMKRQTLTNATNSGTIRADEIIPPGASTNFTLVPHEIDTELVLNFRQRQALFGTGPGCTSDPAAPDSVLAFGTADDYASGADCSPVSLSARVAGGVSSLSTDGNTGTGTNGGSGTATGTATGTGGGTGSSSRNNNSNGSNNSSNNGSNNGSNGTGGGGGSGGNNDSSSNPGSSRDDTTTSTIPASSLPSSTDSGPITSSLPTSSESASPGSSGPSSPSNTGSPESCSGSACSSAGPIPPPVESGCVASAAIPASLSCPSNIANNYITLDRDVYSLCTGYSITRDSNIIQDVGGTGTINFLACLKSCKSSSRTAAYFKANRAYDVAPTWSCGCGTTQSYVTPYRARGEIISQTAAVFICSNTFDYTGETPDPARTTITMPPKTQCFMPLAEKVPASRKCYDNPNNNFQYISYRDRYNPFSLCPKAQFATTTNIIEWSTFSTLPVPLALSDCVNTCNVIVGPDSICSGVALVADSTINSNGYRIKCVMATGDNLSLSPEPAGSVTWLTAAVQLCTNDFPTESCNIDTATPEGAACCRGAASSFLYTRGQSVFNVCAGCMLANTVTLGPTSIATENAIFIDKCISSYCQSGSECVGVGVITKASTTGDLLTYQCVSQAAAGELMTSELNFANGQSFYGTYAAFLCTNSYSAFPSPAITSDRVRPFQLCESTIRTGVLTYTSYWATTSAWYGWATDDINVRTYAVLSGGCTNPCGGTAGAITWPQECAVQVGADASYFEVVRQVGQDGVCFCRWSSGFYARPSFAGYTRQTNAIEVYGYYK